MARSPHYSPRPGIPGNAAQTPGRGRSAGRPAEGSLGLQGQNMARAAGIGHLDLRAPPQASQGPLCWGLPGALEAAAQGPWAWTPTSGRISGLPWVAWSAGWQEMGVAGASPSCSVRCWLWAPTWPGRTWLPPSGSLGVPSLPTFQETYFVCVVLGIEPRALALSYAFSPFKLFKF